MPRHRRYRFAALTLLTVTLGAGAAHAESPRQEGEKKPRKLIYISNLGDRPAALHIHTMNPDGTQPTPITKGEEIEMEPSLSPDGKTIAFVSIKLGKPTDPPQFSLGSVTTEGTERKTLVEGGKDSYPFSPTWSPDGKRIAYSLLTRTEQKVEAQIFAMDADGKNPKALGKGLYPHWSPDGKTLAYTGIDGDFKGPETLQISIMNVDGTGTKKLSKGMFPVWSPDGKRIAYVVLEKASSPRLYVMGSDGKNSQQLTPKNSKDAELGLQWSEDGKRLYFSRISAESFGQSSIFVMDANGKNVKPITKAGLQNWMGMGWVFLNMAMSAAPSPDGK